MFDANDRQLQVAIVGCGAMGCGIAQLLAQAGVQVLLFDTKPASSQQALHTLHNNFARLQDKGKLTAQQVDAAKECLKIAQELSELSQAAVVIEAIIEDLAIKQQLFLQLEEIVASSTVLASNTSSLSITSLAQVCAIPQRVAGLHFFNPVPLMKVVEVVAGLQTAPAVLRSLAALVKRCGHLAVQAKDTPGFIVNHAGRGYGTESLQILTEQVASAEQIDCIMRQAAGFRLGPFELFDLIGLDVSVPVMQAIYQQYFNEPRYRPSVLAAQRKNAGLLGRKSGQGFYRYEDGKAVLPPTNPSSQVGFNAARLVWVSREEAQWGAQLAALIEPLLAKLGPDAKLEQGTRPSEQALCLVTPVGEDVTTCLQRQGLDGRAVLGVDMLLGLDKHRVLLTNPLTLPTHARAAQALLMQDGVGVSLVRDSVGLVLQRVLAQIVNIACDMAQQGIASPGDIDQAVRLGLAYPHGPLTWGDQLGPALLLRILQNMSAITGDMRYRPSPWLRRRAQLQASLLLPEMDLDTEEFDHA